MCHLAYFSGRACRDRTATGYRLIAGPTPNFLTRDETVHKNQVASSFSEPEADPGHMAIGSASPGTRVAMAC